MSIDGEEPLAERGQSLIVAGPRERASIQHAECRALIAGFAGRESPQKHPYLARTWPCATEVR